MLIFFKWIVFHSGYTTKNTLYIAPCFYPVDCKSYLERIPCLRHSSSLITLYLSLYSDWEVWYQDELQMGFKSIMQTTKYRKYQLSSTGGFLESHSRAHRCICSYCWIKTRNYKINNIQTFRIMTICFLFVHFHFPFFLFSTKIFSFFAFSLLSQCILSVLFIIEMS